MGSAGSHGIQLTPVRTTTYSTTKHYQGRRINRYAHPHNRVLPPPVAGQRLRSTDNGSILQEKGTIRGQRAGGSPLPGEGETEFLRVLQRRSERSLDGGKNTSIGSKWQSYSDPNITYSLQISDSSKKSKSSKKIRAPAPPPQKKKRNGNKMKSPAPPPPIVAVVHAITPKSHTSPKLSAAVHEGNNILFPDSRPNDLRHVILEKRNHPLKSESVRKTITENRNHINEAFSEEIREATKRIADKMGKVAKRNSVKADKNREEKSPKQYYFPDVEIKKKGKKGAVKVDEATNNDKKSSDSAMSNHGPKTKRDQVESNGQENLHIRNRISYQQSQLREWESERNSMASSSCYSDTLPSMSGDEDDDINLKLRPTLPRRQLELPRFSPTEAWKFLGISNLEMPKESVPSSEGEDEERMWRINKLTSPKTAILERCEDSGISPDADSPVMTKDKHEVSNKQQTIVIGQHSWIPQQDLLEDSDSNEFDDCIRNRRFIRVPVKLALPNDMFCSKLNNFINKTVNHDDPEQREHKIKNRRNITKSAKQDGLSNIRKTLGMRTKSPYANRLDSNWLLNQKNGKNYRLISNYNYVNSGGQKQLQSLIFGIKKEKQKDLQNNSFNYNENCTRRKFSFYSTEGHVIYLPEYETVDLMRKQTKKKELERKYSSRRNKISDRRLFGMTEINGDGSDEWILQMQKQYKREREKEKITIRDKLKLCQMDRHPTPKVTDENFQICTQSLENLSDKQESTNSPLLRSEWKSTPAELNNLPHMQIESSTSSPSSPEIVQCNTRKPYTGASKWMRRQRQPPQKRNFSPTRPEPEGGGASSDENLHQATDDTPTDNSQSPIARNPSVYTQLMEMAKEEEQKLKSEEQLNATQVKSSFRADITETEPKQKFDFEKEGAESSWKFKSVYPCTETSNEKDVPKKSKELSRPCVKTFYMELEERMKQINQQSQNRETDCHDANISRGGNGIVKTILPNVVVNEGGYKSVIQLSSVKPFAPNKGYRPVPFKVPAIQKENDENKSTELSVPKSSLKI